MKTIHNRIIFIETIVFMLPFSQYTENSIDEFISVEYINKKHNNFDPCQVQNATLRDIKQKGISITQFNNEFIRKQYEDIVKIIWMNKNFLYMTVTINRNLFD